MKLFIDFDSTFIKSESLDFLAEMVDCDNETIERIKTLTDQAMCGTLSFHQALVQRLELISLTKDDVELCIEKLRNNISTSFVKNKDWLIQHAEHIVILSGGFKEIIVPIVAEFGLGSDQVYANDFIYNTHNKKIIGINNKNFLAHDNGKAKVASGLLQKNELAIILGDGYNDYVLKQVGIAEKFYLFIENIYRKELEQYADKIVSSLDEITEIVNDYLVP